MHGHVNLKYTYITSYKNIKLFIEVDVSWGNHNFFPKCNIIKLQMCRLEFISQERAKATLFLQFEGNTKLRGWSGL